MQILVGKLWFKGCFFGRVRSYPGQWLFRLRLLLKLFSINILQPTNWSFTTLTVQVLFTETNENDLGFVRDFFVITSLKLIVLICGDFQMQFSCLWQYFRRKYFSWRWKLNGSFSLYINYCKFDLLPACSVQHTSPIQRQRILLLLFSLWERRNQRAFSWSPQPKLHSGESFSAAT